MFIFDILNNYTNTNVQCTCINNLQLKLIKKDESVDITYKPSLKKSKWLKFIKLLLFRKQEIKNIIILTCFKQLTARYVTFSGL